MKRSKVSLTVVSGRPLIAQHQGCCKTNRMIVSSRIKFRCCPEIICNLIDTWLLIDLWINMFLVANEMMVNCTTLAVEVVVRESWTIEISHWLCICTLGSLRSLNDVQIRGSQILGRGLSMGKQNQGGWPFSVIIRAFENLILYSRKCWYIV